MLLKREQNAVEPGLDKHTARARCRHFVNTLARPSAQSGLAQAVAELAQREAQALRRARLVALLLGQRVLQGLRAVRLRALVATHQRFAVAGGIGCARRWWWCRARGLGHEALQR